MSAPDAACRTTAVGARSAAVILKRSQLRRLILRLLWLFAMVALLFPIVYLVSVSFKSVADVLSGRFLPSHLVVDNWPAAYAALPLPVFFRNSMVDALASSLLALGIALPAAYGVVRYQAAARTLPVLILSSYVAPPVVVLLPIFYLVRALNLINTLGGLSLVHGLMNVPVAFWLLESFVRRLPIEVEEAAAVDGAGPLTLLSRIVIPLLAPGIAATAIVCAVLSYDELLLALTLTYSPDSQTLPVAISLFQGDRLVQFGQMAVASLSGMAPVYLLALAGQRWLVSGLTTGATR